MPPKLKIGFPESWSVVKLKEPPNRHRANNDYEEFDSIGNEQGAPAPSEDQRINKKYVTRPNYCCEPVSNKLITGKEQ
jgi:hypothetical protein